MASNLIVVPLLNDKVDDWKQLVNDSTGARANKLKDRNARYGVDRERAWLLQNPDGSHLVVVLQEGDGADKFMERFATSEHPFDVEFRDRVGEMHGIDFTQPPPPPSQLYSDTDQL